MQQSTIFPADSTEFVPNKYYSEYFVCGTYHLAKNDDTREDEPLVQSSNGKLRQTRIGQCLLFRCNSDGTFQLSQTVQIPAVLDMKWSFEERESPRLAIAEAQGVLRFYDLESTPNGDSPAQLKEIQQVQATEATNLCLSLDWSNRRELTGSNGKVVVSISDGSICTVEPVDGMYAVTREWHGHDHEPWIAAWNYWDTNVVYTGGDDICWKGWDIRTDLTFPTFVNKRSFEGGVTSIQAHPHVENYVAVGSYDEQVRLFDVRKPAKPVTTVHVGGGAWRVKWHPSPTRKTDLLIACMHDGFKVVRFTDACFGSSSSEGVCEVITRFDKHTSLAYGVDWQHYGKGEETLVASCSFYDCSLMTWKA
ncbi:Diphthine methyltransferase; AltName: Full=Diphthamide biosynthesis protein 7; Short=DPH7; AltName: Full=WD repeat-containing protein 85 [Serendipita indica DSM 11827]|uniref:methylated diphthine methylhydrolase n=1 Tax=Serendipita indica (strain DSM 11827) TaxID=1109443 RepID=G4TWS3_SERID|nr:Diphthine methyltransferase; AltName: Full=Diphthamide biosynthesis protein 7; Short=DPH7; AltName: Full=WD repeat-containing protein 85 [Serendipita indica DSM 11827]CCA75766.1 hypothetical protein PIIN_09756 [Serendipita indica DSM 11827]